MSKSRRSRASEPPTFSPDVLKLNPELAKLIGQDESKKTPEVDTVSYPLRRLRKITVQSLGCLVWIVICVVLASVLLVFTATFWIPVQ